MHGFSIALRELIGNPESKQRLNEKLPDYIQHIITDFVTQIDLFDKQISAADKLLAKLLPESHPQIKLLMTAPGIGPVCSRIIYTEILDIAYFKEPKYLISYSGLAPVEQESAGKKGQSQTQSPLQLLSQICLFDSRPRGQNASKISEKI